MRRLLTLLCAAIALLMAWLLTGCCGGGTCPATAPGSGFAQDLITKSTVTLSGVVDNGISAQAGHVAGAKIYAVTYYANPAIMAPVKVFTTVTGDDGHYKLALPAGLYTVHAEKDALRSKEVALKLYQDTAQNFLLLPAPTPTAK